MTFISIPDSADELNIETENNIRSPEVTVLNTRNVDLNNETVLNIEVGEDEQKANEAEFLKAAVCTDHGLHTVGYRESKRAKPTSLHVNYGIRRDNNPVWVQFLQRGAREPMDEDSRGPFVQLVFGILFLCLLVTLIFAVCTFIVPGLRDFIAPFGTILAIVGSVIIMLVSYKLTCFECGRRPPCNFCGLLFAVIGECLIFGGVTARFGIGEIVVALGITCAVVVVCFALAFTPLDFTKCYIYLVVIGAALCMFGLVVMTMSLMGMRLLWLRLLLCCCFIVFHAFSLVMELQAILGGRSVEMGEDDYILGAFLLYTSIMSLFFQILIGTGLLDEII